MYYIILNPWSGKGVAGRREGELRAVLDKLGMAYELALTPAPGAAEQLAREAAERGGYRAVVAAGGDGTICEVANGLAQTEMPMGFMPIGTGNDFVKMFGLSTQRLEEAALRLRDGAIRRVDLGKVNGRYFLNGVGAGFDARVAVEAARFKRLRGFAVYVIAIVRALSNFHSPEMTVTFDGQTVKRRLLLVSVGNGRSHGGGFWLTPQAQINDGLFDICLVDRLRMDEFVRHVPKVLSGRHTKMRQVTMARARKVLIEPSIPVAVHADGEVLGTDLRRVEIDILPGALRVLI